ncbi:MAG: hypothetical protein ABJN04_06635 [Hyphomicrobiales bacterium]
MSECSFENATPVTITKIDDHGVLFLGDARRLKLADLFFPLNKETGTLSSQTLAKMRRMIVGHEIRILASGPADRYGREPVFLYAKDASEEPNLAQEALIRSRSAAYMPNPQLRKTFVSNCEFDQIKVDLIAIAPKEPTFGSVRQAGIVPVLSANSQRLWGLEGEFVIIQGTVTEVRRTKRGISINFGDNWKKDFTAYLSPLVSKTFENSVNFNSNLVGQQVQLRGFLDLYYGPSMRIDHLTQMEMLSE